jgi:hypothetical protein
VLLENFTNGSTIIAMRGIFAMLLVALFSFSLISPAVLASDADSNLAVCCRRGGKHHCAMMATPSESSSGPSVQAGTCPFFPVAKGVPASRTARLPGISQAVFARLVSHPASRPQKAALCRISFSRAGQKRGPPILLS